MLKLKKAFGQINADEKKAISNPKNDGDKPREFFVIMIRNRGLINDFFKRSYYEN